MNVNGVSTDANNVGGVSPPHVTESPNQSPNPFISSTLPMVGPTSELAMDPSLDFSDFSGVDLSQFMTSDTTISSTSLSPRQGPAPPPQSSSSSDVRIDVGKLLLLSFLSLILSLTFSFSPPVSHSHSSLSLPLSLPHSFPLSFFLILSPLFANSNTLVHFSFPFRTSPVCHERVCVVRLVSC